MKFSRHAWRTKYVGKRRHERCAERSSTAVFWLWCRLPTQKSRQVWTEASTATLLWQKRMKWPQTPMRIGQRPKRERAGWPIGSFALVKSYHQNRTWMTLTRGNAEMLYQSSKRRLTLFRAHEGALSYTWWATMIRRKFKGSTFYAQSDFCSSR